MRDVEAYSLSPAVAPTGLRSEDGVRSKSQHWRTGLHPLTPTGSEKEFLILGFGGMRAMEHDINLGNKITTTNWPRRGPRDVAQCASTGDNAPPHTHKPHRGDGKE